MKMKMVKNSLPVQDIQPKFSLCKFQNVNRDVIFICRNIFILYITMVMVMIHNGNDTHNYGNGNNCDSGIGNNGY